MQVGTTLLGKYQVLEILGQGGMGVVAKAIHTGLNEDIAIKCLRSDVSLDKEAVARFVREAQSAVKLKSEHVARVTDVGTFEDGKPYMVMEFLDGQDLEVFCNQSGRISHQLAIELILQAGDALSEAHSLGIVHRDIKPTNLFITWRPDGSPLLKVLDFGISKSQVQSDLALTQTQSLLGTPAYMSPEQMRSARTVDPRSDVWSLATVLYEILEGTRPFAAESFSEMVVKVTMDPPTPMKNVSPQLAAVIAKCFEKAPENRYQTVADFCRALAPFSRDPQTAIRQVERMQRMLGRRAAEQAHQSSPVIAATAVGVPSPVSANDEISRGVPSDFRAANDRTPIPGPSPWAGLNRTMTNPAIAAQTGASESAPASRASESGPSLQAAASSEQARQSQLKLGALAANNERSPVSRNSYPAGSALLLTEQIAAQKPKSTNSKLIWIVAAALVAVAVGGILAMRGGGGGESVETPPVTSNPVGSGSNEIGGSDSVDATNPNGANAPDIQNPANGSQTPAIVNSNEDSGSGSSAESGSGEPTAIGSGSQHATGSNGGEDPKPGVKTGTKIKTGTGKKPGSTKVVPPVKVDAKPACDPLTDINGCLR